MSPSYTQEGKPMRVRTALPDDTLLLERLTAVEGVSRPFELTLDLLSTDATISPKKLLGKDLTVSIDLPDGGARYFHGIVRRFVQRGRASGLVAYEATVVPTLWFLSLATDCRIFQGKSVPEIVKSMLGEMGITDHRASLTAAYPKRDYCVQYRESDLDFISRLLEEEGIFYFFEHAETKHTLVLADSASAVKPGPVSRLPVGAVAGGGWKDFIEELEIDSGVSSGQVTLADYIDTEPKRLQTQAGTKSGAGTESLRVFDYPGKFSVIGEGERLARVRLEEREAPTHVVHGRAHCRALGSGQKLDVTDHYRRDANGSYHLLSLSHVGRVGGYRSTGGDLAEGDFSFETSFVAIPHAVPYRPERTTPKSIVHGSQTAIVVGPSGEEIYVDKFGRVKVQFFWDREGKHDEKSSCWVRVSSAWAGKQWGAIQIPRIGQEVIVDFLEGDPDRPIITGRVYNAEQMPPYALPDHGTQSGVKSRSSKHGGASEANEFRFEDMKGCEEVYLHAQKDLNSIVLNDERRSVGNNRTTTIGYEETKTVTKGNETITIEKGDQTITLKQGSQTIEVYSDHSLTIKTGNTTTNVSMGNQETTVKMGNILMKANLGGISGEAMQNIELKVGQSSVKLDQTGVQIKGMMVKIEGQVQTEVKGMMTMITADGILAAKGGMTMIN